VMLGATEIVVVPAYSESLSYSVTVQRRCPREGWITLYKLVTDVLYISDSIGRDDLFICLIMTSVCYY